MNYEICIDICIEIIINFRDLLLYHDLTIRTIIVCIL